MSARSSACSPLQSTERCFLLFWRYWLRRALWEWDTSSSDLFLNIWFNYIYNSDCAEGTRGLPPSSFIMKQNSSPDSRAYEKFPEADGRQTLLCVFPITLNHHSTSFFFFFLTLNFHIQCCMGSWTGALSFHSCVNSMRNMWESV